MAAPDVKADRATLDYATPPPAASDRGRATIGWAIVVMLLGGVGCAFVAVLFGGAGHGWSAPSSVSRVAMFASPLSVVAWATRGRPAGKMLGLGLVATAAVADAALAEAAASEGSGYFERSWSSDPGLVIVWVSLWAAWQVMALSAMLWPRGAGPTVRGGRG